MFHALRGMVSKAANYYVNLLLGGVGGKTNKKKLNKVMLHASCRKGMTRAAEWRCKKSGVMDAFFYIYVIMIFVINVSLCTICACK